MVLQVPCRVVWRVLRKRPHLSADKGQIVQDLKPDSKPHRRNLHQIDIDPYLLRNTLFSDEVSFIFQELAVDATKARGTRRVLTSAVKVNIDVWGGLVKNNTLRLFLVMQTTLGHNGHFDIIAQFVYPRVSVLQPKVLQQEGTSPLLHSSWLVWDRCMTPFRTAVLGSTGLSLGYRVHPISHLWVSVDWSSVRSRVYASNAQSFPTLMFRRGGGGGWQGQSV